MIGVEFELLIDFDMYFFIEKGFWGGIVMIFKRYVKVNNLYLNDYDL